MTSERVYKILDILSTADLKSVSNYKLKNLLIELLEGCPLPSTTQAPTIYVERGRANGNKEIEFNCEKDISYIENVTAVTNVGRANLPMMSIFYGCTANEKVKEPRIAVCFEALEELRIRNNTNIRNIKYITVGKWASKKDLKVVHLIFSTRNLKLEPYLVKVLESFKAKLRDKGYSNDLADAYIKVIEFLSNCFEMKVTKSDEYKFTAVLSSLIFYPKPDISVAEQIDCIFYQSVQTEYDGACVAIRPKVIEDNFELVVAGVFKIVWENDNIILDNHAVCNKFDTLKTNFEWELVKSLSDIEYDKVFSQMKDRKLDFK